MGVKWEVSLSKKLDVLNTLYPIMNIKDYPKRSNKFKHLVNVYDPMAIILLIIEDITSTFNIVESSEVSIDHKQLVEDILPFLKMVDEKRGEKIDEVLQIAYIEEIIQRLCSNSSKFHQVPFIDYLDPDLKVRVKNLVVLSMYTPRKNEINYRLNPYELISEYNKLNLMLRESSFIVLGRGLKSLSIERVLK